MKIVICGSISASKQMMDAKVVLEAHGYIVVAPRNIEKYASGEFPLENNHESTNKKIEHDLIRQYYNFIQDADAVLVVNCDKNGIKNYIGGNSFLEAGFAHALNKKLYFLNDIPDMVYTDELLAFQPIILHGNLDNITL